MKYLNQICHSERSEESPGRSFTAFRMTEFILLALILVLCGLFSSCQSSACGTTETGNPVCTADSADAGDDSSSSAFTCSFCYDEVEASIEDGDSETSDDADTQTATETLSEVGEVLFGICDRATECYGVEELDCIEAVYTELNMLNAFGADFVTYSDFEELQTGVDAGLVVVSDTTLTSCVAAIEAVSCEELDADEAYDESTESYDRLYLSVPTACRQVF